MVQFYGPSLEHGTQYYNQKRTSLKDVFECVQQLQTLAKEEKDYDALKDFLPNLVEVTVKWKFPEYTSWQRALNEATMSGGEVARRELEEKIETVIRLFAEILTKAVKKDRTCEWAIRSLVILVDDQSPLYHKKVTHIQYHSTSHHSHSQRAVEEGAAFLQGVAATVFQELEGFAVFAEFESIDAAPLQALMRLLGILHERYEDSPSPDASCQAVAARISAMQPTELVGNREYLQQTLEDMFCMTLSFGEDVAKPSPCREARIAVESAWWALVSAGIRSQNLLARRACAELLGKARQHPLCLDMTKLSAWLRQDNIFEELFGSRQDLRVLEDMDLKPFCEESEEGVRTLLNGIRPALGQEIIAEKFFWFALKNGMDPGKFGRDVIVIELCRWIRPMLREGSADAIAFITRFFSLSCMESNSKEKRRMIGFVAHNAQNELTLTLGEALLTPCVSRDQLIELEAALYSTRAEKAAGMNQDAHDEILSRIVAEVDTVANAVAKAEASGTKAIPLRREVLRTLLRILELYPFEVGEWSAPGIDSRQTKVVDLLQGEKETSLSEKIWKELVHILPDATTAEGVEDVELRLRVICYLYRCCEDLHISPSMLSDMVAVLKGSANGWRYICYLLRIASAAAKNPVEDEAFPVFTEETVDKSLQLLEDLALEEHGLNIYGFFCLQQAMLLVNSRRAGALELKNNECGKIAAARAIVVGDIQPSTQAYDPKLKNELLVGLWVKVRQDLGGNYKIARVGKFDAVADCHDLEYIDETRDRDLRNLGRMRDWDFVPSLLEQRPFAPSVSRCSDVQKLAGIRGLWACALGGESDGDSTPADLAAALLLSLHHLHPQALLDRLRKELSSQSTPMVVGRCLGMLKTLIDQRPPTLPRSHLGTGFPCALSFDVFEYKEVWVKRVDGSMKTEVQLRPVQQRQDQRPLKLEGKHLNSQSTVEFVHQEVTKYMQQHFQYTVPDSRWDSVDLYVPSMDWLQLDPHSRRTLEEWGLKPGTQVRAEQTRNRRERKQGGIMDELGEDGEWPKTLLGLLENSVGKGTLSPANRALCWELLMSLSTYKALETRVQKAEGCDWGELLDRKSIWHSIYYVRLIEAWTSSRHLPKEKDAWIKAFSDAGGIQAVLKLFFEAFDEPLGDFERSALLPVLVKVVPLAFNNSHSEDKIDMKNACAIANAAVSASQWLFHSSKNCSQKEIPWLQLRLRYAAADSLEILKSVTKGNDLPLSTLDEQALPLLVELVQSLEGYINSRVADVVSALAERPDCAKRLLQRLAQAVRAVAERSPSKKGASTERISTLCNTILSITGRMSNRKVLREESSALMEVAVEAVLASKAEIRSLYRLISELLNDDSGACKSVLSDEVVQKFAERLLRCVLPETTDDIGQEDTREAGANLLLQLLSTGIVKTHRNIQLRVFSYLTMMQAPDDWNFAPTIPEEPNTELNAPRNGTGHVGLINRGSTCYMNSTVQQLFWSEPFRHAIKKSSPPLASASDKPEPLPNSGDKKSKSPEQAPRRSSAFDDDERDTKVMSKPSDVGWQFQRAFAFLEDCQQGLYNTDELVEACSCLNLEYSVRSQNDASEFLDRLCDKLDEVCDAKPSHVLTIKTAKEKRCHHCGLRTKSAEESQIRLQINTLAPTLEECFQNIVETESMVGDNRVECDNCKEKRDTSYQTYFTQLPQIMVVHLGRMSFDYETLQRVKLNDYLAFPTKLNMSKYTEDAILHGQAIVPGCTYELQGVQIHQGFAGAGHYYSFAQDRSGKWFKFNDDRVSPFDLEDLEDECFGGSDGRREKSNNAYMLFYRCVEASPYSSQAAVSPVAPIDTVQRSLSDTLRSASGDEEPHVPKLERSVTAATASNSEELQQKMQKWKQDQLRRSLKEEIVNMNGQLHRHQVVFSKVTLRFLHDFMDTVWSQIALAGATEESLESKTAQVELCRLTALAFFEVILHARNADTKQLSLWLELFHKQLDNLQARSWLISVFSGQPEPLLSRRTSSWLPSAILQCDRNDGCEAVVRIAFHAAERHQQSDGDLHGFWEAIVGYISRIHRPYAMKWYGSLWQLCIQSESLRPLLLQYRGAGDLSLASLLLHAFCGVNFSPLDSPPAPPLAARGDNWLYGSFIALLECVGSLLKEDSIAKSEQVVRSESFWKALAITNPDVFEADGPIRALFPNDDVLHQNIGQTLLERMRPTGDEHPWYSEHYRGALAYVLKCGSAEKTAARLALLSQVGEQHILANARAAAFSNTGGYYANNQGYNKANRGPKNPDAIQLLRLLQVVAGFERPMNDTWNWAGDWLREVMLPTQKWKWGLPIDEVEILAIKFARPQQEKSSKDAILVFGAGDPHVNGTYTYVEDDGEVQPCFRHENNEDLIVSSSIYHYSRVVWRIQDIDKVYYQSVTMDVDSAFPPLMLSKWIAKEGKSPPPALEVLITSPTAKMERLSPERHDMEDQDIINSMIEWTKDYQDDIYSDKAATCGSPGISDIDDDLPSPGIRDDDDEFM